MTWHGRIMTAAVLGLAPVVALAQTPGGRPAPGAIPSAAGRAVTGSKTVEAGQLSVVGLGVNAGAAQVTIEAGQLSVVGLGVNAGSAQVTVEAGPLSVVGLGVDAGSGQKTVEAGVLSVIGAGP